MQAGKNMSYDLIIQHFIHEIATWERLVDFLTLENVFFKTRLAELVNDSSDEHMLVIAEKFQDEFLAHDGVLSFLAAELKQQNELLSKSQKGNGRGYEAMIKSQEKVRTDMQKAEELFTQLKSRFSDYLTMHFQFFR